jgi:hypothetical protein
MLLCAAPAAAEMPLLFSHTGRLLDGDDRPVNGNIDLTIRFYARSVDPEGEPSSLVWENEYAAVPVVNGFYTLLVGDPAKGPALDPDDWDAAENRWMGIAINGGAELTPRLRVVSVPWALQAGNAAALEGKGADEFAAAAHTHAVADVTGFDDAARAAMGEKGVGNARHHDRYTNAEAVTAAEASGKFAAAAHPHLAADVTDFADAVAGTPPAAHLHDPDDVTGLADHTHEAADVTDFGPAAVGALAGASIAGGLNVAGNVGIGTTSPAAKLDVNGNIRAGDVFGLFTSGVNAQIRAGGSYSNLQLTDGGGNAFVHITASGGVGLGTTSPNAAAALDVSSTSRGFLPPRMTTAQRDAISSPPEGLIVYNATRKSLDVYNGAVWSSISVGCAANRYTFDGVCLAVTQDTTTPPSGCTVYQPGRNWGRTQWETICKALVPQTVGGCLTLDPDTDGGLCTNATWIAAWGSDNPPDLWLHDTTFDYNKVASGTQNCIADASWDGTPRYFLWACQ